MFIEDPGLNQLNKAEVLSAAENLVPYSKTSPVMFREPQLVPIKDLKLLIKDYPVCVPSSILLASTSFLSVNC